MREFSFDQEAFYNQVSNKTYKLADVQHRIERVAFDVVRFRDGNTDELWQIQNADDGDYIVAKYDNEPAELTPKTASIPDWDVAIDNNSATINIFYRNYPVAKLSALSLGLSTTDLPSIKSFLPRKLATDKVLRDTLYKSMTISERQLFLRNNPELQGK